MPGQVRLAAILVTAAATAGAQAPVPPATAVNPPAILQPGQSIQPGAAGPQTRATLVGMVVRDDDGRRVGEIVDVVTDDSGRVRQAVIALGGFLGIGARRIVVEREHLGVDPERAVAVLTITE